MYNELYLIWRTEKESGNEIQRLPKNFYAKIADYIKKLKEENRMLDNKTTKAHLLDTEFKNVQVMVGELFGLRYRKFRKNVFLHQSFSKDALTEEEKKLYGDASSLSEACHLFCKDLLRGNLSKIEKNEKQAFTILRFVQEIPALVGSDMKTYGPFGPEDIANLPTQNARIFIKQGVAVKVDAK